MTEPECIDFLKWALPRLGLRWAGYRNVRRQVEKRLRRRMEDLGLSSLTAYRARLEADAAEWRRLGDLCGVTISRFYRDRGVWEALRRDVLPAAAASALAVGARELRCWSLGCASGEEPYTLTILWTMALAERHPALRLRVLATDFDEVVLARAGLAEYGASSLRELPERWREEAFDRRDGSYRLRDRFRVDVALRREDVRAALPEGPFHLILCRNLVFTYFAEALQRSTLNELSTRLSGEGFLVIGRHERLPAGSALEPWAPQLGIFRKAR